MSENLAEFLVQRQWEPSLDTHVPTWFLYNVKSVPGSFDVVLYDGVDVIHAHARLSTSTHKAVTVSSDQRQTVDTRCEGYDQTTSRWVCTLVGKKRTGAAPVYMLSADTIVELVCILWSRYIPPTMKQPSVESVARCRTT